MTLTVDGRGIFYGFAFVLGTNEAGTYKVTAYDQMRYLKNEETLVSKGETASQVFSKLCVMHGLRHRVVTPSVFIPEAHYHDKRSLYSIMEFMMTRTTIAERRSYFIRDDFGTLQFTAIDRYKTDLMIGDGFVLSSYQYEINIDKDTYNTIKVVRDNEATGRRDVWVEFDSGNQRRWGKLQKVDTAAAEMNEAEIQSRAATLLQYHNRPRKTIKLTGVGVPNADCFKLFAGAGFLLKLEKLGIAEYMWIVGATHTIESGFHTFSLDVYV